MSELKAIEEKLLKCAQRRRTVEMLHAAQIESLLPLGSVVRVRLGRADVTGEVVEHRGWCSTEVQVRNVKTGVVRRISACTYGLRGMAIVSVPPKVMLEWDAWCVEFKRWLGRYCDDVDQVDMSDYRWMFDKGMSPVEGYISELEDEL